MIEPIEEMLSPSHVLAGGYITLSVALKGLPQTVNCRGTKMVRKEEFHITIISTSRVAGLIDADNSEKIQAEIIKDFRKIADKDKMKQFKLLNQFRFVTRDTRKTIVAVCEFPGGDEFFASLESKFGMSIPRQPFHITIYSLEPSVGISLSSPAEINETTEISMPELKNLKPA
jgi:hypothetical protein